VTGQPHWFPRWSKGLGAISTLVRGQAGLSNGKLPRVMCIMSWHRHNFAVPAKPRAVPSAGLVAGDAAAFPLIISLRYVLRAAAAP